MDRPPHSDVIVPPASAMQLGAAAAEETEGTVDQLAKARLASMAKAELD